MRKTNVKAMKLKMKYEMSKEFAEVTCEDCNWRMRDVGAKELAITHAHLNEHRVNGKITIIFKCDGRKGFEIIKKVIKDET